MDKKLYEPKHFEFPKQVKFLDMGDTGQNEPVWHGGIAIDDTIICGCCGMCFAIEEIFADWNEYGKAEHPDIEAPIEIYDEWVDISNEIKGDD